MNLTGSICSIVGPAVTKALNFLFFFILIKYFFTILIISSGSDILPSPYSPQAISPIEGPISL